MGDYIIVIFFVGLFLVALLLYLLLPYFHKNMRDYVEETDSFYELEDIEEDRDLEKKIGKLVRKVVDKPPIWRSSRVVGRRYGIDPIVKKPDYFWKYYLTFETFDGYLSFTVTKDEYKKYRTNTYGYIYYQDTRFSHFEYRTRESLNLDELIKKNYKK